MARSTPAQRGSKPSLLDGGPTDHRCGPAALERTRFDRQGRILRGMDWFVFEPETFRIQEVRPYNAAPVQTDMARQELLDFDYVGRGYPTMPPTGQTRGKA